MLNEDSLYIIKYVTKATGEESEKVVTCNGKIFQKFFDKQQTNTSNPQPNLQSIIQLFSFKTNESPKSDVSFKKLEKQNIEILESFKIDKSILKDEEKFNKFFEALQELKKENSIPNAVSYKNKIITIFKEINNEVNYLILSNYGDIENSTNDDEIYFHL